MAVGKKFLAKKFDAVLAASLLSISLPTESLAPPIAKLPVTPTAGDISPSAKPCNAARPKSIPPISKIESLSKPISFSTS